LICVNVAAQHAAQGPILPGKPPAFRDGDRFVMHEQTGDLIVGLLVGILGLIGLFLASGALDDGIYVFGLSLAAFAVVFDIGLVKRHFDRQDAARAEGGHV
jgi:hypothetical protein